MKQINASNRVSLPLGRQQENLAREVVFDVAEWERLYGIGTAELLYQRPGENLPHIMEIHQEGALVHWPIGAWHTELAGSGKCEVRYYVGETLVKSKVWNTVVDSALTAPDETAPTDPQQNWLDQMLRAGATAEDAAKRAEAAAYWVSVNDGFDGGQSYQIGHGLEIGEDYTLQVRVADDLDGDSSLPVSAAAVRTLAEGTPAYVKAEADRVAQAVLELQNEDTVSFAVVSDVHVNYGNEAYAPATKTAIVHAGAAMKRIAAQAALDFMCNLGDNLWGSNEVVSDAMQEQQILNEAIYDAFRTHPNFRLVGNHDANRSSAVIPTTRIYGMNGRYNDYDVCGDTAMRGYGYKEFPRQKLRVIALNTSDYMDLKGGYGMSDEQKRFFMEALDLSGKEDAAQWQTLILSHFPLDFPESDYNTSADVNAILSAYQSGGTVSIPAGSYSYVGKNMAHIIANIHGHIHNFSRGVMDNGVLRVCTPNTCFYLNGDSSTTVTGLYLPNEIYPKTAKTAEDTTVTIYTVDLKTKVIHSTNYGAGYDRQLSYADTVPSGSVSVTVQLANATSDNNASHAMLGAPYTALITAESGYTLDGAEVTVTMGGADITAEVYSNGLIKIPAVTGEITVTIIAQKKAAFVQTVGDLAVSVRQNVYYNTAESMVEFQTYNSRMILAASTENPCAFPTRESTTVYLLPIPAEASSVSVSTTDTKVQTMAIQGFNYENGTYPRQFDSGWMSEFTYAFEPGAAQYMTIVLAYSESDSVAWGYDVKSNVTVTFHG